MIWKHTAACLALLALVVSLYAPVLSSAPVFDDFYYLERGQQPIEWQSRPLSHVSFRIGGGDPSTAHAVNVGLHALAALLLYAILFEFFPSQAFVGALLFAVHPLFGQGAQYITARASVMASLFVWAALYADLKLSGRWKYPVLTALCLGAAASKYEGLLVLPLLVLFRLIRNGERRKVGALMALGLVAAPLVRWANPFGLNVGPEGKFALLGIMPVLSDGQHVVSAIRSYVEHTLPNMVAPATLTALPAMLPQVDARSLLSPVVVGILAAAIVWGRPLFAYAAASLLFAPPLFKALIPVGDAQFEYRAYMAGLGFALLACWALSLLERRTARVAAVALALALAVVTFERHQAWTNGIALWADVVEKDPTPRALVNLGLEYQNAGMSDKAIAAYESALRVAPDAAVAYMNLGGIYTARRDFAKAQENLEKAARLAPNLGNVWVNYSALLVMMNQPGHALVMASRAVAMEPKSWSARQNKAIALLLLNRTGEASKEEAIARELKAVSKI